MFKTLFTVAGTVSLALTTASAGELRLGVAKHDLTDTEDGFDIQAQVLLEPNWFGFLNTYVVASSNSEGALNLGGIGLQADMGLPGDWFAELEFGVVIHDGRTELPPPWEPVERQHVLDTEKTYGCDVLFQTQPAIGKHLNDRWSAAVYWEHLSHGQILCDDEKNEGLDNVGLRLSRRF